MSLQNKFKRTMAAGVAAGAIAIASASAHAGTQDGNVYHADDLNDAKEYSFKHCTEPMYLTNIDPNSSGHEGMAAQAGYSNTPVVNLQNNEESQASILLCGHSTDSIPYTNDIKTNIESGNALALHSLETTTHRTFNLVNKASITGDAETYFRFMGNLKKRFGETVEQSLIDYTMQKRQEREAITTASVNIPTHE